MIIFDRYEDDRMFLGFTEAELAVILTALEKNLPEEDVTKRLDALMMRFMQQRRKKEKER